MSKKKFGESGFTLIELLVAITILAVSAGVFVNVFTNGLSRSNSARLISQATHLGQSIQEQVGATIPLVDGVTSGDTEGMSWRVSVRPFQEGGTPINSVVTAHVVKTTVAWGAMKHEAVTLTTLRLKPVQ